MTPEGVSHTTGIDLVADCLRRVFGSGFHVRIQHPLAVDDYSEPEPDVAVVKGTIRDYAETHPRGGGARRRFFRTAGCARRALCSAAVRVAS